MWIQLIWRAHQSPTHELFHLWLGQRGRTRCLWAKCLHQAAAAPRRPPNSHTRHSCRGSRRLGSSFTSDPVQVVRTPTGGPSAPGNPGNPDRPWGPCVRSEVTFNYNDFWSEKAGLSIWAGITRFKCVNWICLALDPHFKISLKPTEEQSD